MTDEPPDDEAERKRLALVKRLSQILEETGLSDRALSARAGLSHAFVGAVLTGRSKRPLGDNIIRVAECVGYRAAWLLRGEGPPKPGTQFVELEPRYESLREVLEEPSNRDRWPAEAVAAVKANAMTFDHDPGHTFWGAQLDRFTAALKLAELPRPPPPDPTSDLDEPPKKK